jgi:hypothetical protein
MCHLIVTCFTVISTQLGVSLYITYHLMCHIFFVLLFYALNNNIRLVISYVVSSLLVISALYIGDGYYPSFHACAVSYAKHSYFMLGDIYCNDFMCCPFLVL